MAITTNPTVPVPGDVVTLTSSTASSGSTRWKLTSQPSGSHVLQGNAAAVADIEALRRVAATARKDKQTRLVENGDGLFLWRPDAGAGVADNGTTVIRPNDVPLDEPGRWYLGGTGFLQDAGGAYLDVFVPQLPGEYGFTAYHYRKTYNAKARATGAEVLVSTDAGTVHVAAVASLPIVTLAGDGAVLRWTIQNATVKSAELVEPTSERARIATLDTAVVAALAALAGVAVSSAGEDLIARVKDLRAKLNQHMAVGGGGLVHAGADATNPVTREPADSMYAATQVLIACSEAYLGHAIAGTSGGTWHSNDDALHVPITKKPEPGNLAEAIVHEADLSERCYELHRVTTASPTVRLTSDATNTLSAPTTLSTLIVAFLDALAAQDPSAAAGEVEGAADAAARYGFKLGG